LDRAPRFRQAKTMSMGSLGRGRAATHGASDRVGEADCVEMRDGDREGVGYASVSMAQRWTNHCMELAPGTAVYLFTDGIFDQLGGEKRIAFGKRRVRACLKRLRDAPMSLQARGLRTELREYQGSEPRKDDVSAIGFRL